MIDDRLLDLLVDDDVATRKRAVMELAKTKDREALKYLAEIFREDPDPEVRDLARKGGLYIKKHLESAAPARPPADSLRSSLYGDDDAEEEEPLYAPEPPKKESRPARASAPAEEDSVRDLAAVIPTLDIPYAQEKEAKSMVKTALDYHMRGDNERAAQHLRRALRIDPRLTKDPYTISLASTVVGIDGPEAVEQLAPTPDELLRKQRKAQTKTPAAQGLMAYVVLVGAFIVLLGFLMFPWIDLSSIPTTGAEGETMTLGESLDEARSQIEAMMVMFGDADSDETTEAFLSAFNNIRISFSGLDSTLMILGVRDVFETMGLTNLFDSLGGMEGLLGMPTEIEGVDLTPTPEPLDYTLVLVPVLAVVALIIAALLLRGPSVGLWIACLVVGLIGMVPIAYFYLSSVREVIPAGTDLSTFGDVTIPSGEQLIGLGFWLSLVGTLIIALLPFIALLTMPQQQES